MVIVRDADQAAAGYIELSGALNLQEKLVNRVRKPSYGIRLEISSEINGLPVIVRNELASKQLAAHAFAFQLGILRSQLYVNEIWWRCEHRPCINFCLFG